MRTSETVVQVEIMADHEKKKKKKLETHVGKLRKRNFYFCKKKERKFLVNALKKINQLIRPTLDESQKKF